MKKLIIFFALALFIINISAQDSLYINKTGGILRAYPISKVDSISFNASKDSILINQTGGIINSFAIAYVDSISFTRTARTKTTTTDPGVIINGVCWSTRNVDSPGTFVARPETYGRFYQWNSNVALATTSTVTGWDDNWNGGFTNLSASNKWATANDPSPAGYRVPTYAELRTLGDNTKVTGSCTVLNGVNGCKFTDKATGNSIFLPVSGYRNWSDGTLCNVGLSGIYWSSTAYYTTDNAYYAAVCSGLGGMYPDPYIANRAYGLTIRPVAN